MNDQSIKVNIEILKDLLNRADKLGEQQKSLKAEIDGFLKQHREDANFPELLKFFTDFVIKRTSADDIARAFKEVWGK